MSASISINGNKRDLRNVGERRITQQIIRRQKDGQPVCVIVEINDGNLNLVVKTGDCPSSGGGGRPPNSEEKVLLDSWSKFGLSENIHHGQSSPF
ncbi:MAG: hypothetical protein L3J79_10470 [Candidatus Marinimicrobia bacterium]|nr:hypothetical protein [Candidatus Neomarinimicrobiota bacterium]